LLWRRDKVVYLFESGLGHEEQYGLACKGSGGAQPQCDDAAAPQQPQCDDAATPQRQQQALMMDAQVTAACDDTGAVAHFFFRPWPREADSDNLLNSTALACKI
jgi:hypothetical protein